MPSRAEWRQVWSEHTDPGHRHADPRWTRLYADELLLHFPEGRVRLLELGCGTGALFDRVRDRCGDYVGIDFSVSMLGVFQKHHPAARLICGDATALPVAGLFNVVLARELCQYLTQAELERNLSDVRRILAPGGRYIMGGIPDEQLRLLAYAGALRSDRGTNWLAGLRWLATQKLKRIPDPIGHWYSRNLIAEVARRCSFSCQTYSSAGMEYRFQAVFEPMAE
jgi:ubiquinone/menaquinone biosynthesis C-methylase UbiE